MFDCQTEQELTPEYVSDTVVAGACSVVSFLKERQIKKLKALALKQELPWAFVARRAIDFYFEALREEGRELDKELEEQPERATEPVRRISAEELKGLRQGRKHSE